MERDPSWLSLAPPLQQENKDNASQVQQLIETNTHIVFASSSSGPGSTTPYPNHQMFFPSSSRSSSPYSLQHMFFASSSTRSRSRSSSNNSSPYPNSHEQILFASSSSPSPFSSSSNNPGMRMLMHMPYPSSFSPFGFPFINQPPRGPTIQYQGLGEASRTSGRLNPPSSFTSQVVGARRKPDLNQDLADPNAWKRRRHRR